MLYARVVKVRCRSGTTELYALVALLAILILSILRKGRLILMVVDKLFKRRDTYKAEHMGLIFSVIKNKHTKGLGKSGVPGMVCKFCIRVRDNRLVGKFRKTYGLMGIDTSTISNLQMRAHMLSVEKLKR